MLSIRGMLGQHTEDPGPIVEDRDAALLDRFFLVDAGIGCDKPLLALWIAHNHQALEPYESWAVEWEHGSAESVAINEVLQVDTAVRIQSSRARRKRGGSGDIEVGARGPVGVAPEPVDPSAVGNRERRVLTDDVGVEQ